MVRDVRKEEINEVEVVYIKGKYQYKKQYGILTDKKQDILFAGPLEAMQPAWENILMLVRNPTNRVSTESRRKLRKLEQEATNLGNLRDKGITHLIIYQKCS